MRYELRLTAYDCLDQIWISTGLYVTRDTENPQPVLALHLTTAIAGTGTSDPREWLQDALLAVLEDV
jgi:hypothetical protein